MVLNRTSILTLLLCGLSSAMLGNATCKRMTHWAVYTTITSLEWSYARCPRCRQNPSGCHWLQWSRLFFLLGGAWIWRGEKKDTQDFPLVQKYYMWRRCWSVLWWMIWASEHHHRIIIYLHASSSHLLERYSTDEGQQGESGGDHTQGNFHQLSHSVIRSLSISLCALRYEVFSGCTCHRVRISSGHRLPWRGWKRAASGLLAGLESVAL